MSTLTEEIGSSRAMGRRVVSAGAAVVVLVLLFATSALAAAGWQEPIDLSAPASGADEPQLAVDPSGDAVAVWDLVQGSTGVVQAAFRPAGGTWQPAVDLSAPDHSSLHARVAIDALGDAIAVWGHYDGTALVIQSSVRPSGGSWQAPATLTTDDREAQEPDVALDPHGDAVAVWRRSDGSEAVAQSSYRPAGSGAWQPAVDLSLPGQNAHAPEVQLDQQGNAVAVWEYGFRECSELEPECANPVIQSSYRAASTGEWQQPVALSAAGAFTPRLAVDAAGNAAAVWEQSNGFEGYVVESANRPAATGLWQEPVDVSAGMRGDDAKIAFDPQGDAFALWTHYAGESGVAWGAERAAADASWQEPIELSPEESGGAEAQIAFDREGDAIVVWQHFTGGANFVIESSSRQKGGTWQVPLQVSRPQGDSYSPRVAFDQAGGAIAIWGSSNAGREDHVETSSLVNTAAPPAAVTEPASAVTSSTATLNASVNPDGETIESCRFEYGTSNAYGSSGPCTSLPGSGQRPVAVSAPISALSPSTTYHFRIVARNTLGTSYGQDLTLTTTAPPPAPTVSRISPKKGPVGGGTAVTITGTNFSLARTVKFGSISAADFNVNSNTSITAVSPPEPAGTVDVTVTSDGGTSAVSTNDRFKFLPTITSLSPEEGSHLGGTTVTVSGSGFTTGGAGTIFKFGSAKATSVNCSSSTECTMHSPPHTAGTVDVTAVVNRSVSAKSAADRFTFT
jgi:hypothetical protein